MTHDFHVHIIEHPSVLSVIATTPEVVVKALCCESACQWFQNQTVN
jgi:hypothetical protein